MAKMYFAEIRDIKDPLKSGMVKVRKYGNEDNEQMIKDEHLPWAMPLMPSHSASTNRIGINPTGLQVGSRVIIMHMDNDPEEQFPIVMGSFYRAGAPTKQPEESDSDSDSKNDYKGGTTSGDLPIPSKPEEVGTVANNSRITSTDTDIEV